MRKASAFSPGHITGFVEFPTLADDPILMGSRGAGFCISRGVETSVTVERSEKNDLSIFINGEVAEDAEVSRRVVAEHLKLVENNNSYAIKVEHELEIPVGYGLGSSGAAALSLSLALARALERRMSGLEAAQIAHNSDLACRCGAGTVLAEYHGGFEMRLKTGAPGVGEVEKIPVRDRKAVILCLAPISTKEFLTEKISLINGLGGKMLHNLVKTRSVDDFMEMSLHFARSIGFVSGRCGTIIEDMLAGGFGCSTAMFGETVFSLVKSDRVEEALEILSRHRRGGGGNGGNKLLVSDIDHHGARMMIDC